MGNLTYDPQSAQIKGAYFRESLFPRDSEELLLRLDRSVGSRKND